MFRSWRLFGNSIIDVFLPEPFLTDSLGKCAFQRSYFQDFISAAA